MFTILGRGRVRLHRGAWERSFLCAYLIFADVLLHLKIQLDKFDFFFFNFEEFFFLQKIFLKIFFFEEFFFWKNFFWKIFFWNFFGKNFFWRNFKKKKNFFFKFCFEIFFEKKISKIFFEKFYWKFFFFKIFFFFLSWCVHFEVSSLVLILNVISNFMISFISQCTFNFSFVIWNFISFRISSVK